ncbi:MAG TPA: ATP-binding cassette domain-containing protein [Longimicrobiales bacterium]|nr:ATP-binding cassette domain-containing protein [Longimicrobiales bacterium]
MNAALLLERVSKRYAAHHAVRDLSLEVPTGSIYGILGPNGAGKSTTLRMVMNIIARDSGRIEVLGQPPEGREVLRSVGYLPEERGLYRRMGVMDVLVFFGRLKGMDARDARRTGAEWLERMGLGDWRTARVDTLSKGMQQKVQFITTVMHNPSLLILDEPQSGLDPVNQEVLRETILSTRDGGGTVVLSTHNMDQAETLCDSVCIIAGGAKVLDGAVRDVKQAYRGDRYRLVLDAFSTDTGARNEVDRLLRRYSTSVAVESGNGGWLFELTDFSQRDLLAQVLELPVELECFERVEPSLHEIFIERVGAAARTARREVSDA